MQGKQFNKSTGKSHKNACCKQKISRQNYCKNLMLAEWGYEEAKQSNSYINSVSIGIEPPADALDFCAHILETS